MSTVQEGIASYAEAAKEATNQVAAKAQEKKQMRVTKSTTDPDQPIGDRVKAGLDAAGDKIEGAKQEAKGEFYKNKPELENAKQGAAQAANDVKEGAANAAQGAKAGAEKAAQDIKEGAANAADQAKAGLNAAGEKLEDAKNEVAAEGATTVAVIKDGAINTLDFIGEKLQGTAEYIKGDETDRNPEGGVVQTLKDGAVATLAFIGETTQQTAEYLRGEPKAECCDKAKEQDCKEGECKSTDAVHKDLLAEVKEEHNLNHVKTDDKSAPVIDPNAHVGIKKDDK